MIDLRYMKDWYVVVHLKEGTKRIGPLPTKYAFIAYKAACEQYKVETFLIYPYRGTWAQRKHYIPGFKGFIKANFAQLMLWFGVTIPFILSLAMASCK